ncbi:MAG TPA: FKBP-type peptidyl-prolyl cis-trans isomerase N-terminal domain-containing protein, partial [Candidatus Acidoferrum sp.]|nr:FKBP-type peptidyl-prolyl cis-trans isomerase N-terminal domain-containing protein [Candidatus Acidoferrum sp.]
MRKPITLAVTAFTSGMMLLGLAYAQQQTPPASSSQNPPAKSSTAPAAKQSTGAAATKKPAPAPFTLKTPKDKASYAYGLSLGQGMKKNSVDLDPSVISRGIRDGL